MRLNVYSEELTSRVEVVSKSPDNHPNESFKGIRMYLASPDVLHSDPDDDDSSAITIWVPWTKQGGHRPDIVSTLLRKMADELDAAYGVVPPAQEAKVIIQDLVRSYPRTRGGLLSVMDYLDSPSRVLHDSISKRKPITILAKAKEVIKKL